MNLTSISTIKNLCKKYDIRPSKKLGQNFLINENILDKIIKAGELDKNDSVLEIGPGFGVLTTWLLEKVGKLIVVEKDKRLVEHIKTLNHESIKAKRLKVISDDILKVKIQDLGITNYKIISNLPYSITSPILWKFLAEEKNKPSLMILMVQKEVAERIISKPGKMSILSVMCQFYAECEKVYDVSRENFWPKPDVDSVIIKLRVKKLKSPKVDEKKFIQMVKIGFSAKRKMLKNNLSNGLQIDQNKVVLALKNIGLNEKIRAQELRVEDWVDLSVLISKIS